MTGHSDLGVFFQDQYSAPMAGGFKGGFAAYYSGPYDNNIVAYRENSPPDGSVFELDPEGETLKLLGKLLHNLKVQRAPPRPTPG